MTDRIDIIQNKLSGIQRQRRAVLPTPVHELLELSAMSGCRVFCKRDDLTGFGFGGNKVRKLDFLIFEAIQAGCDTLLAVGSNQSNFCRTVASYGNVNGMSVHLVLGGKKPDKPTGNLLLDHLLGAVCHHIDSASWEDWEAKAASVEDGLKREGRRAYRMPIGGSTTTGSFGYVEAMAEILNDEKHLGLSFDAIISASASAGTQAGLVAGKSIAGWPGRVLGFSVAKKKESQEEDVFRLAQETANRLGASVDRKDVSVDDSYLGGGYARRTKACEEAVLFFARKCGIFLDYVYTGKAAAGLLDYLKQSRFSPKSTVLFLHTGGNIELFE